jgi:predicted small secreted protein
MTDIKMKKIAPCLLLVVLAFPLSSCLAATERKVPDDVANYVQSRDNCDSLRGDIPEPDPEDPENINRVVSEINKYCKGTDQQLKQLKEKYSSDESIMKRLSGYEENIEADMSQ